MISVLIMTCIVSTCKCLLTWSVFQFEWYPNVFFSSIDKLIVPWRNWTQRNYLNNKKNGFADILSLYLISSGKSHFKRSIATVAVSWDMFFIYFDNQMSDKRHALWTESVPPLVMNTCQQDKLSSTPLILFLKQLRKASAHKTLYLRFQFHRFPVYR